MWFIHHPDRLKTEAEAIERLQADSSWLPVSTRRLLPGLRFSVDFDLVVNGEILPFTLTYPAFFPETPPSITPRDGRHYSSHQWSYGGELCLEFRSDNWDPAITGAMMIESAYRLLSEEQPTLDRRAVVPAAHQSSLGQQLRSATCRFILTRKLRDSVGGLDIGAAYPCRVIEIAGPRKVWTAHITSVGPASAPIWQETTIPSRDNPGVSALLIRIESLAKTSVSAQADLDKIIAASGVSEDTPANDNASPRFTVLADTETAQVYFSYLLEGAWKVLPYRTIDLSQDNETRLPDAYASLAGKKVGLVGCGSLGSKIAPSLARSGVRQFVLVDDDILKPGNLTRHELDAAHLGEHKAYGLEAHLKAVAQGVAVSAYRVALGGQESSGSTAAVLDDLATCDLLIDATADPQAFNFVASVALRARRPMIWAEVYAGGIGGYVARLRPDIEPPPHAARRQYLAWCRAQGVSWHGQGDDYDVRRGDGPPLIADDADVAVIAAHTTRMASDVLVRGDVSAFPSSAYVIGLTKDWIFDQPFDTHPVSFSDEGVWPVAATGEQAAEALQYMVSLLEQTVDDADRTGT